jgi:hypothetical protein
MLRGLATVLQAQPELRVLRNLQQSLLVNGSSAVEAGASQNSPPAPHHRKYPTMFT